MKRFFLGLTLLVIALIQTAPAWLLDLSLQSVTNGRIRLTQAHGRIWHGSGTLARAAEARTFTAWLPVDWSFEPAALRQGQLQWIPNMALNISLSLSFFIFLHIMSCLF